MANMDQKEWEERLDRAADRVSHAVTTGVHLLENEYEKRKDSLQDKLDSGTRTSSETIANASDAASQSSSPEETKRTFKGSPRTGLVLVAVGIIWLLNSLGVLSQPIFPILLIAVGVYFIARAK